MKKKSLSPIKISSNYMQFVPYTLTSEPYLVKHVTWLYIKDP